MAIDGVTLSCCRRELEKKLLGARVDKAYQPSDNFLTLKLRIEGENPVLLTAIDPRQARIHITEVDFSNPPKPPVFAMVLRKYLQHARLEGIKQPGMERMLEFKFKSGSDYRLIAEIMGRYSNVILVDENNVIKDAMKRIPPEKDSARTLMPNEKYQPPPPQDKTSPLKLNRSIWKKLAEESLQDRAYRAILNNIQGFGPDLAREIVFQAGVDPEKEYRRLSSEEKKSVENYLFDFLSRIKNYDFQPALGIDSKGDVVYQSAFPLKHYQDLKHKKFSDTAAMFDYFYENHILRKDRERRRKRLKDIINNYQEKNEKQQHKIEGKLEQSRHADKYKRRGELLKANLHRVEQGQQEVEVIDYYQEDQPEITIPLDGDLTPADNVEKLFKKYNKLKKSRDHLIREMARFRHEEKYLNQVELKIDQAETMNDLDEIENELVEEGYIQEKEQKKSDVRTEKSKPRRFYSEDGYQVLVGRNNRQNDRLTTQVASEDDLWVHTRKIAGSHVIVRNHRTDREIPETTIHEAALLAAYYSQARQSKNVPVDFTTIKNVSKPKGAKPGIVYYDNHSTLYVTPEKDKIKKIAGRDRPEDL